jgi:hypothetical protein
MTDADWHGMAGMMGGLDAMGGSAVRSAAEPATHQHH